MGRFMIRILVLFLLCLTTPATAQDRVITFKPATTAFMTPERGWWRFATGSTDFLNASQADLDDFRDSGLTMGYAIVRLDAFKTKKLSGALLADLDAAFVRARKAGIKVMLRFAYNYPESSQEYADAKDATLARVLEHIAQLKPFIAANADTITVMQAGFIGAWGEGHTSSNGLDTPTNKGKIRDALLAATPADMQLQFRYPPDLIRWQDNGKIGRFGLHNDCFLSSPTDVGTYAEGATARNQQRATMAALTATTYFSGETCDADPELIRNGCGPILAEGPQFHLSALGQDYYTAFHDRWKRDGCYREIEDKMGYRLRIIEARIGGGKVKLKIVNEGWAKVYRTRPLKLIVGTKTTTFSAGLQTIDPGETVTLTASLPAGPAPTQLCLAAPDPSARLAGIPYYALRFANANTPTQKWAAGKLCFTL
jgi:Domain of unknown function (DUF4874)/Domain of unknown function (DUF4832)